MSALQSCWRLSCLILLFGLLLPAGAAMADPAGIYRQALSLAADGREAEAVAALSAAQSLLAPVDPWRERMLAAATLLELKRQRRSELNAVQGDPTNLVLAAGYAGAHPLVVAEVPWYVTLFAVVLPGAGHAWQGRWHDAGVAAMLVWPMLLLTWWAARRRMGPVTLFFAMITVWLWSGTIFSSVSLAERASYEEYLHWWQGTWQASGLPGQPW